MDTIGVGIIGLGFGARVHLPGFRHLAGVNVMGLAGSNEERARAAGAQHGIEAYGDYRRLLDRPEVQLVSISAPAPLHHDMVLAALERGKHVICEKPFASNVAQAEDMLRRAEGAGIVHAIDFEFRYAPARQAMKALLEEGYVGQPRLFTGLVLGRQRADPNVEVRPWSAAREGMGGPLGAVAVHVMDSACWLLGEVAAVSGRLETFYPERAVAGGQTAPATADDLAAIELKFRQPAVASIQCSFAAGQPLHRLEVHGSEGSLVAPDHHTLLGGRDGAGLQPIAIDDRFLPAGGWRPEGPEHTPWFAELASRVLARIRGDAGADFPTFHDGLASQRLVDAIYRSSDTGQTVALQ